MTSRHWTGVFIALFFVLWLSMCSYSDAQDYTHPPLGGEEIVQLPFPTPACRDLADPDNGRNLIFEVVDTFTEMVADTIVQETELPEGCSILPPQFLIAFIWQEPGIVVIDILGERHQAYVYGAQSPLEPGLWFVLVIDPAVIPMAVSGSVRL